jgi:hypothetical protein
MSRMHGAIPPLPQYVFMAWCLVEHRDNFRIFSIINNNYNDYTEIKNKCSCNENATYLNHDVTSVLHAFSLNYSSVFNFVTHHDTHPK